MEKCKMGIRDRISKEYRYSHAINKNQNIRKVHHYEK